MADTQLWEKLLARAKREDPSVAQALQDKIDEEAQREENEKAGGIVTGANSLGSLLTNGIEPSAVAQLDAMGGQSPQRPQSPQIGDNTGFGSEAPPVQGVNMPYTDDPSNDILSGGLSNANVAKTFTDDGGTGTTAVIDDTDSQVQAQAEETASERDALKQMLADEAKKKGDMDRYLKILNSR